YNFLLINQHCLQPEINSIIGYIKDFQPEITDGIKLDKIGHLKRDRGDLALYKRQYLKCARPVWRPALRLSAPSC
ncbi:MAG: hypothetical protein ACTSQI_21945, partial [Candidatus Helarchaeota archaeon]